MAHDLPDATVTYRPHQAPLPKNRRLLRAQRPSPSNFKFQTHPSFASHLFASLSFREAKREAKQAGGVEAQEVDKEGKMWYNIRER